MKVEYNWFGDNMIYKILIVEDDPVISQKMEQFLVSWNYEVKRIIDFTKVMEDFISFKPDIVLMDITLPHLNGYHWTTEIRKISKVPILFVSSANDNMNIVMAISQGADDYITKPFELQILAAKIQALLRRAYDFAGKTQFIEHKGVRFNSEDNTVTYKEQSVELTKNEAKILRLLLEKKNTIVNRDALMESLWKTDFYVDENALSVNVNRLRKKLEQIGVYDFIITKKGIGYLV